MEAGLEPTLSGSSPNPQSQCHAAFQPSMEDSVELSDQETPELMYENNWGSGER